MGIFDIFRKKQEQVEEVQNTQKLDLSAYKTSGLLEPLTEEDKQTKAYQDLVKAISDENISVRKVKMDDGSIWYSGITAPVDILKSEKISDPYLGKYEPVRYDVSTRKSLNFYLVKAPSEQTVEYNYDTFIKEYDCDEKAFRKAFDPLSIDEVKKEIQGNPKYADLAEIIDLFFNDERSERRDKIKAEYAASAQAAQKLKLFKSIDPQEFAESLKSAEDYVPQYYAKTARISARPGKVGEEIVTKMKDGHTETKNTVQAEGDMVVTNPNGEQYIVDAKTFAKKYEIDPTNPKQYRPKGGPQEFVIVDENVTFTAPWGETMRIKAGGALNITNPGDVYGIQKEEFEQTYAPCDKEGHFSRDAQRKRLSEAKNVDEKQVLAAQMRVTTEPRHEEAKRLWGLRKSAQAYKEAVAQLPAVKDKGPAKRKSR